MRVPQYKYVVLFFLYIAQAIPMSFFQTAVPVYLRQRGVSLAMLGMLSAMALPAALRFLWAPLVDAKGIRRVGNYKSWIIPLQIITILLIPMMTLFDWVAHFTLFFVLCFFMTLVGATQDTGVDGLAIRALSENERPTGAAVLNSSVLIGMALGGGVMVTLFEKLGLNGSLWVMTAVYTLPLLFLLPYREPALDPARKPASFKSIITIFKRPEIRLWMLQQTLLMAGIALGTGMMIPMLVDQGYKMTEFGLLQGVLFPIVGGIGTVLAPSVIRKFGRRNVVLISAAFLCVHLVNLIVIHQLRPPHWVAFALISFMGFTNVFLFIAIHSVVMDLARPETAGTDWTIQAGILGMTGAVFGAIGGIFAQRAGYLTLLVTALIISALGIAAVARYFRRGYLGVNAEEPPAPSSPDRTPSASDHPDAPTPTSHTPATETRVP
jgi:MFS transporter, PAT family, beta-lactamase induction signal transducer AmpG